MLGKGVSCVCDGAFTIAFLIALPIEHADERMTKHDSVLNGSGRVLCAGQVWFGKCFRNVSLYGCVRR